MILFYIGRLAPFLADLLLLQDLREHTEGRRETPSGHLPSRILPLFFVQELRDRKRPPGARDVPRDLGAARSLRSPNIEVHALPVMSEALVDVLGEPVEKIRQSAREGVRAGPRQLLRHRTSRARSSLHGLAERAHRVVGLLNSQILLQATIPAHLVDEGDVAA